MTHVMTRPRKTLWLGLALLLALPALAMQFTDQVAWSGNDFLVFAAMLAVLGLGIETILRTVKTRRARMVGLGMAALAFLAVWAMLAVG